jgi:hypothetical protein
MPKAPLQLTPLGAEVFEEVDATRTVPVEVQDMLAAVTADLDRIKRMSEETDELDAEMINAFVTGTLSQMRGMLRKARWNDGD